MTDGALVDKLNRATDKAVSVARQKCLPIHIDKNTTLIDDIVVAKTVTGLYSVRSCSGIMYTDISSRDIAIIIAQRYKSKEMGVIRKIISLEKEYSKHKQDMMHYLNSLKKASKKNDDCRIAILEDRFYTSEYRAKLVKNKILVYKKW